MGYIDQEIAEEIELNRIKGTRLDESTSTELANKINNIFFDGSSSYPDPIGFKSTKKSHYPDFWSKVSDIKFIGSPILGIFDKKIFFWKFETGVELKSLLTETTGFPFWLTDDNLSLLIYFDDHDCVHEASSYNGIELRL